MNPRLNIDDATTVVYLPRGNAARSLELEFGWRTDRIARWFDPRTGKYHGQPLPVKPTERWLLPARPAPHDEDWVLVINRG